MKLLLQQGSFCVRYYSFCYGCLQINLPYSWRQVITYCAYLFMLDSDQIVKLKNYLDFVKWQNVYGCLMTKFHSPSVYTFYQNIIFQTPCYNTAYSTFKIALESSTQDFPNFKMNYCSYEEDSHLVNFEGLINKCGCCKQL